MTSRNSTTTTQSSRATNRPRRRGRIDARGSSNTTAQTKIADMRTKPDIYIECREIGHKWLKIGYFHWSDKGRSAVCRKQKCERCDTTKDTYLSSDGVILESRYDYPDHYLAVGEGRVAPSEVRREAMRRSTVYGSEATMLRYSEKSEKS